MSNYHFFGCSWTGWEKTNYVEELSKLVPEHNFYNWGQGGSSIALSTYLLDAVKKNYTDSDNYFIFQVTTPRRVSWWNEKFDEHALGSIKKIDTNYFKLPFHTVNNWWQGFSPSYLKDKSFSKYHKNYYSINTDAVMHHEYKMHYSFAKNNSDYIFRHLAKKTDIIDDVKCIQDILDKQTYEKYLSDDNSHFAINGSKWQAQWIMKELRIGI
jgi:hypothetical protein